MLGVDAKKCSPYKGVVLQLESVLASGKLETGWDWQKSERVTSGWDWGLRSTEQYGHNLTTDAL